MSGGGGGEGLVGRGAGFAGRCDSSFTEVDCFGSLDFTAAVCFVFNSSSSSLELSFSASIAAEASERGAMLSPPSSSVVDGSGHAGPLG